MKHQELGVVSKMNSRLENNKVHYQLPLGSDLLELNPLINKKIKLSFEKEIICIK